MAVANDFVRVLVRVPEAYWLVKDYKVSRPGALFLDAAGRKLAAVALDASKPDEGAAEILAAAARAAEADAGAGDSPPSVEVALDLAAPPGPAARPPLREVVERAGGVLAVRVEGKRLLVSASRLFADPDGLAVAAELAGAQARPASHERKAIAVQIADTPATLFVGRLEKLEGIVSAWPDLARREVRVLLRRGAFTDEGLRSAAADAGLSLRPSSPATR
ncbi:MAG: hypothetical protein L0216_08265 [Planctomycetales bacterium]|nr:hypothetical protein [Planctomycetales bacterium]